MNASTFLKRNGSTILTVVGSIGVVGTSVLTYKATTKASKLLDEIDGHKLPVKEKIKLTWPIYVPPVLLGVSTISCILGANVLNKKEQASLISAYGVLSKYFKDYKLKVEELYGQESTEKVEEELAKDSVKDQETDKILFYDTYSNRFFESTMYDVQKAEYYLNRDLIMRDYAYLNEFYDYLGLPYVDDGWKLGWTTGVCLDNYWQSWIDFNHKDSVKPNGQKYKEITMWQEPIRDFEDYC